MTNKEAIKWLNNLMTSIGEPQYSSLWHYIQPLTKINDMLLLLPSAQTEIVRCKDCRHRDPEDHKCDSGEMERQGCPFKVADDYFCAYGER